VAAFERRSSGDRADRVVVIATGALLVCAAGTLAADARFVARARMGAVF